MKVNIICSNCGSIGWPDAQWRQDGNDLACFCTKCENEVKFSCDKMEDTVVTYSLKDRKAIINTLGKGRGNRKILSICQGAKMRQVKVIAILEDLRKSGYATERKGLWSPTDKCVDYFMHPPKKEKEVKKERDIIDSKGNCATKAKSAMDIVLEVNIPTAKTAADSSISSDMERQTILKDGAERISKLIKESIDAGRRECKGIGKVRQWADYGLTAALAEMGYTILSGKNGHFTIKW